MFKPTEGATDSSLAPVQTYLSLYYAGPALADLADLKVETKVGCHGARFMFSASLNSEWKLSKPVEGVKASGIRVSKVRDITQNKPNAGLRASASKGNSQWNPSHESDWQGNQQGQSTNEFENFHNNKKVTGRTEREKKCFLKH
jgi:hypothetical protein